MRLCRDSSSPVGLSQTISSSGFFFFCLPWKITLSSDEIVWKSCYEGTREECRVNDSYPKAGVLPCAFCCYSLKASSLDGQQGLSERPKGSRASVLFVYYAICEFFISWCKYCPRMGNMTAQKFPRGLPRGCHHSTPVFLCCSCRGRTALGIGCCYGREYLRVTCTVEDNIRADLTPDVNITITPDTVYSMKQRQKNKKERFNPGSQLDNHIDVWV